MDRTRSKLARLMFCLLVLFLLAACSAPVRDATSTWTRPLSPIPTSTLRPTAAPRVNPLTLQPRSGQASRRPGTVESPTPTPAATLPSPSPIPTRPALATPTAAALPSPSPTLSPQAGGDSIGDPKAPELGNTGYDVLRYTLSLAIDPEGETISGTTTVEATATLPGLSRLSLDYSGPEIKRLRVDAREAAYQLRDTKLFIDLPHALAKDEVLTIVVAYGGHPSQVQSEYLGFIPLGMHFVDGMVFVASEPDGAHSWFPCNDHPRDKALFRYEITVPKGYVVAANGQPQSPIEGETSTTFVWEGASPMATYLATIAVGHYQIIDETTPNGIPLRHYVPSDLVPAAQELLTRTSDMIVFLEQYFGPYPFESYGHVVVPMNGVSLETQTMTLIDAGVVARGLERIVVHELAHQWFGDSVSPASWADIWLNEGFATYASWLWDEARSPDGLVSYLNTVEAEARRADSGEPLADPSAGNLFGFNSYSKGAWVLRMLRHEIGDEAFFRTLQTYHEWFKGSVATTDDFQVVTEVVSGQDLDWFFDQWVYGQRIPRLAVNWKLGGDGSLQVQACQRHEDVFVFDLPLVAVGGGAQRASRTLEVDEFEERITLSVGFAVSAVQIDPDQLLLAEVDVSQVEAFSLCP